jgi:predicted membrane protein
MLYESEESWGIISQLLTEKIAISYFGIQFIIGSVLPLFILGGVELGKLDENVKTSIRVLAASLVLIGVFAMRWNVVIGGQLISKSLRGFISYNPPLLGIDGILAAAVLMILPFVIFAVIIYLLPPWEKEVKLSERKRLAFEGSTLS